MRIPRSITLACFGIFVLMGALQALYGPLIPSLRDSYNLSAASAGLILSAHFAGATLGIFGFGITVKIYGYKKLLIASLSLLVLSCMLLSLSQNWILSLGITVILGLGYGSLTAGINELFAYGFADKSAAMLNLVNAAFGIGATLGPLGLVVTGSSSFQGTFLVLGIVCIPLVIALISKQWQEKTEQKQTLPESSSSGRFIVVAFAAIIFVYGLLEAGASAWQVTHLYELGFSESIANGLKAAFWAFFTLGRLISAPLSLRFKPKDITLAVLILTSVLMFASFVFPIGFLLYPLTGLLFAPIYTCVLAWFAEEGGGQAGSAAPIMAAGLFASVLSPPALGAVIGWQSALILPLMLGVIAVLAVFMIVSTRKLVRLTI